MDENGHIDDIFTKEAIQFAREMYLQTPECKSVEELIDFIRQVRDSERNTENKRMKVILNVLIGNIKELGIMEAKRFLMELQLVITTLSITLVKRFIGKGRG